MGISELQMSLSFQKDRFAHNPFKPDMIRMVCTQEDVGVE